MSTIIKNFNNNKILIIQFILKVPQNVFQFQIFEIEKLKNKLLNQFKENLNEIFSNFIKKVKIIKKLKEILKKYKFKMQQIINDFLNAQLVLKIKLIINGKEEKIEFY